MGLLIAHPLLAVLPAILLAALWAWRRRTAALLAALAWLGYTAWEWAIHAGIACRGECNIRIDLLIVYPLLLALTLWALIASLRLPARPTSSSSP